MEYPNIYGVACLSETNRTLRAGNSRPLRHGDKLKYQWWGTGMNERQQAFQSLKVWADENNAFLVVESSEYDGAYRLPYLFVIMDRAIASPNGASLPEWNPIQADCWECNRSLEYPSNICNNCMANQTCNGCRTLSEVEPLSDSGGYLTCHACSVECERCEIRFSNRDYACPNCGETCRCAGCGNYYESDNGEWIDDPNNGDESFFCNECYQRTCNACGAMQSDISNLNDDGYCRNCATRSVGEDDDLEAESDMQIPSIPGRENVLLCGVEIEGSNAKGATGNRTGNLLARNLNNAGLSYHGEMTGYHSGSGHRRYKVHVERDGSVDWEMVIGTINMGDPNDVTILDSAVKTVRGMIRNGEARLDMRAGLHIHVEAARVGLVGAYNLYRYYMHTEDFLYRLGAAKWPFHRAILGGRGHPEKNPEAIGKLQFARTFTGNRYYGLSFDNYFARYFTQCQCGARQYGMFEECTCDLGKCTFEFRLFNTTANTTKVHAYLALCQALVAKASSMPEVGVEEYPSFDFYRGKVKEFSPTRLRTYKRKWEKCVEFVNNELPLTDDERRSIYYCVANSEIGDVVENSGILLERKEN